MALMSFKTRDTKLKIFFYENQHTRRKLLNFENWTTSEPYELAKPRFTDYGHPMKA